MPLRLMRCRGLAQVRNWYVNTRNRDWKPTCEAALMEKDPLLALADLAKESASKPLFDQLLALRNEELRNPPPPAATPKAAPPPTPMPVQLPPALPAPAFPPVV
jgi:hypothetical protein